MAAWQTADARQRFGEPVDAAHRDGPQLVMRHTFESDDVAPVGMSLAGGGQVAFHPR